MKKPYVLLVLSALASSIAVSACSSNEGAPTAPSVGSISQALDTNTDLISAATCADQRSGRIMSCTIRSRTLTALDVTTAIPLRTTFTVNKNGNCSTTHPLKVTFQADG